MTTTYSLLHFDDEEVPELISVFTDEAEADAAYDAYSALYPYAHIDLIDNDID